MPHTSLGLVGHQDPALFSWSPTKSNYFKSYLIEMFLSSYQNKIHNLIFIQSKEISGLPIGTFCIPIARVLAHAAGHTWARFPDMHNFLDPELWTNPIEYDIFFPFRKKMCHSFSISYLVKCFFHPIKILIMYLIQTKRILAFQLAHSPTTHHTHPCTLHFWILQSLQRFLRRRFYSWSGTMN